MGLRLRHISQHAAALTLLVVPLGCMSVGGHQLLVAENQTLEVANEKLSAAVEQYELDASTFEQQIFELEMLNATLGEREARIRIEAEDLLDRVHTLESASLSVYIDASSLAEAGAAAEGASSAGLLSALTAEIEAGRVNIRLVPRSADGRIDIEAMADSANGESGSRIFTESLDMGVVAAGARPKPAAIAQLPSVSSQPPAAPIAPIARTAATSESDSP
jgi:hypothetical protein